MRILKYPLAMVDRQCVEMPARANILSVKDQRGMLTMWAAVSESMPMQRRYILIVGTGNPAPSELGKFIGTVIMQGGIAAGLVWHVFDQTDVPEDRRQ